MNKQKQKQLRWRCRRGMLELDCLLQPFFDQHFDQLSMSEKQTFADLLTCEDQQLYDWFLGKSDPECCDFQELIAKIQLTLRGTK